MAREDYYYHNYAYPVLSQMTEESCGNQKQIWECFSKLIPPTQTNLPLETYLWPTFNLEGGP